MSTRQYKGARYVPIIDGEWDNTKSYDPLVIVTHEGDSYTSKTYVPVGAAITNETYWACTGNYNAQVAAYRAEVEDLSDDVSKLNNKVSGKKYIFIGDSFNTTDTPPGGVPIYPWSTELVTCLGLTSDDYKNRGIGGAGFVHGVTFQTQLETLAAQITDKENYTNIIVLGGINDVGQSYSDVTNAIVAFYNYAAETFPNAMITIGVLNWDKRGSAKRGLANMMVWYNDLTYLPRLRVITNLYTFYHNYYYYQPDGHPARNGSTNIARCVANVLKGVFQQHLLNFLE